MMVRNLFSKPIILIIVTVCSFGSVLDAQYDNKNPRDLKAEAIKNFDSGNYSDALEQYKSLLKRFPKDGIFSYYCGLSLLNMNKDIPKAIEFLELASSTATVPKKVFYYLGDAYTRNYQFPEARKAYDQFATVASKTEKKELMPVRLWEMSVNAVRLTTMYNQIDVLASSLFTFDDWSYVRQVRSPGSSLSLKPIEFLPTSAGLKDLSNLMFIPRNIEKGDILFYAGYGKNKKRGSEIYMVKAGNDDKYSVPESIEALNTDYDEIMPYYDPIGNDLTFASKGYNTIGGFDLFKSHYDTARNSWSPPMNLGFPVNSPSDEFLMIPGTNIGSFLLITDRQDLDSMITAYLLRIEEPPIQMSTTDPAELKKIGKFGGKEVLPDMVDMRIHDILKEKEPKPSVTSGKRPKPEEQGVGLPADYNMFMRLALDQQFKADSLARLAREARIQVKNIVGAEERWNIQKNIISWEKESAGCQSLADEYYLKVKQPESQKPETKKIPEAIVKDTVINDITVYKYKQGEAEAKKPEIKKQAVIVPKSTVTGEPGEVIKPANDAGKIMNRFVILDKSPYSANSTFPEDMSMPKGAYYKIQLAALSQNPKWDAFGGLSPVTIELVAGKPLKKYYAGKFNNYESTKTALEEVRKKGFSDAFIVGWYDGQKLSVSKVIELEKK